MKIKRKIPMLQAIIRQAIFSRFPEIENFSAEGSEYHVCIPPHADVVIFAEQLGRYLKHLLDEFGEDQASYTFHLVQRETASYQLIYSEVNNITAIPV